VEFHRNLTEQAAIPAGSEFGLMTTREQMRAAGLDDMKIVVGEFLSVGTGGDQTPPRLADIGALFTQAGWLHSFIRQGDVVMGANNTDFTPLLPNQLQTRLPARIHLNRLFLEAGNQAVRAKVTSPVFHSPRYQERFLVPTFNIPLVDVVVVKHPETGMLSIGMLNKDWQSPRSVTVGLENFQAARTAELFRYYDEGAIDAPDGPVNVPLVRETITVGESPQIVLPPHSYTMLRLFPK
jgi:hypothetical protein